jgi:hypothetical protein
MKKIIALTGKKGTGKTTLAMYIKSLIMRYDGLINNDRLNGTFSSSGICQKIEDPYNIYINDVHLDIDSCDSIKICSFAHGVKMVATDILGLSGNQVYGTQEEKNSPTEYFWENMPLWIRWENSKRKSIFSSNESNNIKIKELSILENIKNEQDLWNYCLDFNAFPINLKSGKMSAREVLQILGTDIFRKMFDENVWVNCVKNYIQKSDAKYFIIDDMRFESELNVISKSFDHLIINLNRCIDSDDLHPSEMGLNEVLKNSKSNNVGIIADSIEGKNAVAFEFVKEYIFGK